MLEAVKETCMERPVELTGVTPRSCGECDLVGVVIFRRDKTHQSVLDIASYTGIRWSSVGGVTHDIVIASYSLRGKQRAYSRVV